MPGYFLTSSSVQGVANASGDRGGSCHLLKIIPYKVSKLVIILLFSTFLTNLYGDRGQILSPQLFRFVP